jgi:aminoglycoside phosphotransferase (APT) family kinase protein
MHRREARIAAALPASVPTPRLLDSYDDGAWVALIFEDIDGTTPRMPWHRPELDRVLVAIGELTSALTPAPIAMESVGELMPDVFVGWKRLAAGFASGEDDLRDVDPWAQRHLTELVALEAASPDAASGGTTLLHADLRADNILLTPSRVFFVDWPWASRGAAWVDLLFMLPSVTMQRGPNPWEIFDTHPLGRSAPEPAVTAVVAAVAGFMIRGSRLPPPPGLPTVRAFQRDQGRPALEWLKRRTGWS